MRKLIIFDVEGTLVDCVPQTLQCWKGTLLQFGFEVSLDALQQQSGRDPEEMIRTLLPPSEASRHGEKLLKEQGMRYRERYLPQVRAFDGVRQLFMAFRTEGWQTALATSCAKDELNVYLQLTEIKGLVDAMACGEDVEREKPHSDLINVALDRRGRPAHAFMVGDTPFDAMAARAAGIGAWGVLTGGFAEADLLNAGCDAVYRDPSHLCANVPSLTRALERVSHHN